MAAREIGLTALKKVRILDKGDLGELAEVVLRIYDAADAAYNRNHKYVRKTRSDVDMVVVHFAGIAPWMLTKSGPWSNDRGCLCIRLSIMMRNPSCQNQKGWRAGCVDKVGGRHTESL